MAKTLEVEAYTKSGGKFKKKAFLKDGPDGKIISFGWPCEYYVQTLKTTYPFEHPICIDVRGTNHYGRSAQISDFIDDPSVYISAEEMNRCFRELGLV